MAQHVDNVYLKPKHYKLMDKMTQLIKDNHLFTKVLQYETNIANNVNTSDLINQIILLLANSGVLYILSGPPYTNKHLNVLCSRLVEGEIDSFSQFIILSSISKLNSVSLILRVLSLGISILPIKLHASPFLKNKVLSDCYLGYKSICLCVSEPNAGSDVNNIECSAYLDGEYYVVSGVKKWISNGLYADYYTVLVKIVDLHKNNKGLISFLLMEKGMKGMEIQPIKCTGVNGSGTALIVMNEVKVPKDNLIGTQGYAFKYMAQNFNHERMMMCIVSNQLCLNLLRYTSLLTHKTTFNKYHRHGIKKMIQLSTLNEKWIESILYQMDNMSYDKQFVILGGVIALLKVNCSKALSKCARFASSIVPFDSFTIDNNNVARNIELINRDCRAFAISGGSEEIMLDLGMRNVLKLIKRNKVNI